jgi:small subunit ribosomal protein S6
MTRPYEAVYVLDSTLEDAAINEKLARYQELLGNPADITVDHWGRRQLAYQIGRKDTGYYVVSRFTADPTVLPEFERALKLDEGVMRYLISLHERETGAPPMTEEEAAAAARRHDDDDDED